VLLGRGRSSAGLSLDTGAQHEEDGLENLALSLELTASVMPVTDFSDSL